VSTATIQRASRTPPRQHIRSRAGQEHPWTFAVPALVVLGLFLVLPTLLNFVLPYTDWSAFKSNLRFVGLANFGSITSDGSLQQALRITLTYAVLVAVFQNGLGLGLALLLERAGPPPVVAWTMSNPFKVPMSAVATLKVIAGASSGNLMRRKIWIPEAPSILPASMSSCGTDFRPAR